MSKPPSSGGGVPGWYMTDFSEYSQQSDLFAQDWSTVDGDPDFQPTLQSSPIPTINYGDKVLEMTSDGINDNDDATILLKSLGVGEDFEILMLFWSNTSQGEFRPVWRHDGGPWVPQNDYYFIPNIISSQILGKHTNGSNAYIDTGTVQDVSTWNWVRIKCQGTNQKMKFWNFGSPEPETWALEGNDSDHESGYVGLIYEMPGTGSVYIDYFAANITGETIPIPEQ